METVRARYKLTETTPLMERDTLLELGLLGDTPTAQAILNGDHTHLPVGDEHAQELLKCMSKQGSSDPISLYITREDFRQYWKRAKEDTSSSISSRHFGHYKAAVHNDTLTFVHCTMGNLSYAKGVHLSRWRKGLTVMLEKEPGVIEADKL